MRRYAQRGPVAALGVLAVLGVLGVLGALAGCAPPAAPSTPVPSRSDPLHPPTRRDDPPRTPSDLLPADIVVGTVTTGGRGPCYTIETDDGVPFALYSTAGLVLARGDRIRATVEALTLKIYCGQGRHLLATRIEKSG